MVFQLTKDKFLIFPVLLDQNRHIMRSKHYDKFIKKLFQGFTFLIVGIFLIFYSNHAGTQLQEWYLWAAASAVIINIGLYLLGSAFIHKVKADFIRNQKRRSEEFTEYSLEQ